MRPNKLLHATCETDARDGPAFGVTKLALVVLAMSRVSAGFRGINLPQIITK
jgi:hypothetical protein